MEGQGTDMERPTSPLDLRRLAQFVAAADHGSLTKAARSLFMSQQAMSAAMRLLEKEVGTELFTRQGRNVVLTAAGRKLREGAPALLAATQSLSAVTRRAAYEHVPAFMVGHTPAITSEEAFELVRPVHRSMPEVSITVRQMFPDEIERGLIERTIDVGLRRGASTPTDLAAAALGYDRLRLAVDSAHPLAGRKDLTLADIAESTLIVWVPPLHSFYTDFLVSACRRAGFEPTLVINPIQGTPPVTAVVDNDYVALVTAPAGSALGGRVTVLDLGDAPMVPIQALWLPHTISAARSALLNR